MVERFKTELAERIRAKDIGLVMIVDRTGRTPGAGDMAASFGVSVRKR